MWKYLFILLNITSAQHYLSLDQFDGIGYKYKHKNLAISTSFYGLWEAPFKDFSSTMFFTYFPSLSLSYDFASKDQVKLYSGSSLSYSNTYVPDRKNINMFEFHDIISLYGFLGIQFKANEKVNINAKEVLRLHRFWLNENINDEYQLNMEFLPQIGVEYQF